MKHRIFSVLLVFALLCATLMCCFACNDNDNSEYVTVSIVNGSAAVRTVQLKKGSTIEDVNTALQSNGVEPPTGMWTSWYYYDTEFMHIAKIDATVENDITLYRYSVALPDSAFKISYYVDGKQSCELFLTDGKIDKSTFYNRASVKSLENPDSVKFYSDIDMTEEFDFTDCNVTYTTDENGARHYGSVTIYVKIS